jgi:hypothetical protein
VALSRGVGRSPLLDWLIGTVLDLPSSKCCRSSPLRTGVDRQYIREKIPIEPCRKRADKIALSRKLEPQPFRFDEADVPPPPRN